jgi:hypothetical protein
MMKYIWGLVNTMMSSQEVLWKEGYISAVVNISGVRSNCDIWKLDVYGYMRYKCVIIIIIIVILYVVA